MTYDSDSESDDYYPTSIALQPVASNLRRHSCLMRCRRAPGGMPGGYMCMYML